jgi:hypothetical protein
MIISISVDANSWISLGELRGHPTSIDIDGIAGVVSGVKYNYVRIQDDPTRNQTDSPYGEADIDAVGAISSIDIFYVDDDALNDPSPYDLSISDPDEDGTIEHPFDMIQEGIDIAQDGDTVVVLSGTYWETIDFKGKNIEVTGFDPDPPNNQIQPFPVIDGNSQGPTVTFNQGEDPNTKLSGFTITRGLYNVGSAILCADSHPTVSNCLIVGNRTTDPNFGAAIYCEGSDAIFENCTIADNYGGEYGSSIYSVNSNIAIHNSIVWDNAPEQIVIESGNDPNVTYSNIKGTWPGEGNIDTDPLFANTGYWVNSDNPSLISTEPNNPGSVWIDGDYHLMSRSGRWDPLVNTWITDSPPTISPCIDKGDPSSLWALEPSPNGECINMGAYGGTSQASKSRIDCCLTVTSGLGGRVIVAPGTPDEGVVEPGETKTFCFGCDDLVPITVFPDPCHYFDGWPDPNMASNDPNAFYIDPNIVQIIDVKFPRVNLDSNSTPGGRIEFPEEPSGYNRYKPVRVIAKPDPCFQFTGWTGTAVDAGKVADPDANDTTVIVDADYTLTANFAPIEFVTLTIWSNPGSSTNLDDGTFTYDCNTLVSIKAIPKPCYEFSHWSGTAVDEGKVKDPCDPNAEFTVDANYTLIANCVLIEYALIISSSEGGSVTEPNEGTHEYDCNESVPIEAVADEGYYFRNWTGTAVYEGKVENPNSASTTVIVDGDYSLKANFASENNTLTVSSTLGGSVTKPGEGEFTYAYLLTATITAVAEEGFHFVKWTGSAVTGKPIDIYNPNIVLTVDKDYSLTAVFAPDTD